MRKEIPKWLFASVAKHFSTLADNYNYYVTGNQRATEDLDSWIELKIDGPHIDRLSSGKVKYTCEVDVQIYCKRDPHNLYKYLEITGDVLDRFTEHIGIFKLGSEPTDDQSYFTCMKLNYDGSKPLNVAHFGDTGINEKISVSDVEGHYYFILNE